MTGHRNGCCPDLKHRGQAGICCCVWDSTDFKQCETEVGWWFWISSDVYLSLFPKVTVPENGVIWIHTYSTVDFLGQVRKVKCLTC